MQVRQRDRETERQRDRETESQASMNIDMYIDRYTHTHTHIQIHIHINTHTYKYTYTFTYRETRIPGQPLLNHAHTLQAQDLLNRRLGIFELGREPRDACTSLAKLRFKVSSVLGCGVCLGLQVVLAFVVARGLDLPCVAMFMLCSTS